MSDSSDHYGPHLCSTILQTERVSLDYTSDSSDDLYVNEVCNSNLEVDTETSTICNLREWAVESNIPLTRIASLLCVLKPVLPALPLSAATFLKSEPASSAIGQEGQSYVYFGLQNAIERRLSSGRRSNLTGLGSVYEEFCKDSREKNKLLLTLQVNVDGVQINKSGNNQLWPITCRIFESVADGPFVIAAYCGSSKPPDLSDFLNPFIDEFNRLQTELFAKGYLLRILCLPCDAPARHFLLCTKKHNSYFGCDYCRVKGCYVLHRIAFLGSDHQPRSNALAKTYGENNQNPEQRTPLFRIVNLDNLPPDYMHLVCLGVMRKLLNNWLKFGTKIPPHRRSEFGEVVREYGLALPKEFKRKVRHTTHLDRWKATEFRNFLLYIGPVALRNFLNEECYKHFLLLHFSIYILSSPRFLHNIEHASLCLKRFVNECTVLYGEHFLTYNVHVLLHLPYFCEKYGPLQTWSCFPFESYLSQLVSRIRSPSLPIQQLKNRVAELNAFAIPSTFSSDICLKTKQADSFIQLKTDDFVRILSVSGDQVKGVSLEFVEDLYTYPCKSGILGICKMKETSYKKDFDKSAIKCKCFAVCLPDEHEPIFFVCPFTTMTYFG